MACDTSLFGDLFPGDTVTGEDFYLSIEHYCPTDTLIKFDLVLWDRFNNRETLTFYEHAISQLQKYFIDKKVTEVGESLNIRGYFLNGFWKPDPGGIEKVYVTFKDRSYQPIDSLQLFDDGMHGDSLAHDGVFGNFWLPQTEKDFIIDYHIIDNLQFYNGLKPHWFGISTIPYKRIGDILLVNDMYLRPPYGELNSPHYQRSLSRLGFEFFYWYTYFRGIPNVTELSEYLTDGTVIWSGPTTPDLYYIPEIAYKLEVQETVEQYLDVGGSLLLSGNTIGEMSQYYPEFLNQWLHTRYVKSFNTYYYLENLKGVPGDEIGNGVVLDIIGDSLPQYRSEEVDPIVPADSVFLFDTTSGNGWIESSGSGAVKYDSGIYKTVFYGFDLAGITDSTIMDTVIKKSVAWLIGHLPQVAQTPAMRGKISIYPNPFSYRTVITTDQPTTIAVYDIAGRRINKFDIKDLFVWKGIDNRGRRLTSGIYFLKSDKRTIKTVIMR